MNRQLLKFGTLCMMLLFVLTGKASTLEATWDFSGEFSSFETIEGSTGTFTNNGIVLTVDATNGKFRANGNSAQMNVGTRLLVPVVSTDDVVSFVAYSESYSYFIIGGENYEGNPDGFHKATSAEVEVGYVVITSTNNNSYIKSVYVVQNEPDPVLEEDLVAMWDWQHANPAHLPDVHFEGANNGTGYIASTVEGVSMYVDATNGKLKGRASDAQFNANTILQIPVKSAKDIVEVITYPGYGEGRLSVGGEVATGDETSHKATTAEVAQGYVEIIGIQESYLYKVQVTFVSPLQEKELYYTDFTDWPTINRKQATNEEVKVLTKYSHEDLTFTLTGVGCNPEGVHAKFSDFTGWMISAKYPDEYSQEEPWVITSPLASLTKMVFTQCATGGNRGWVIAVKGEGDEDWVPILNQTISNASGETHMLTINRNNVQLKFSNFNLAQNSYMVDLRLFGKVDLSQAPSLASFTANGVTYQAADLFIENADGNMEGTIEISVRDKMIGPDNPLTDIITENGEVGEITYVTYDDPAKTVATIPVEYNGQTRTYLVNAVWKPSFTVTYMNGETVIGKQSVEKGAPIEEFAYTAADVEVEEGNKFRGWCFSEDGGQKATEATIVTGDMNLYALVTDIEGDEDNERNCYDFRLTYFYPEDHEALSIEGTYSYNGSQHGYDMKPGTLLKLYVAGNATIVLSNCRYGGGVINVLNPVGEKIGTFSVPSNDGEQSAVSYTGEAGWITLEMTAQSYIHYVNVINTGNGALEPVNGYYIAEAGNINSLLNILDMVTLNKSNERVKIFLPDGTYDMGKAVLTPIPQSNISLIGQSMDKTIIKNAPNVKDEGISKTATFLINGGIENTYFQDLTLHNALDFYSAGSAGRAVCLQDKGNHTISKRMRMLSFQDTYYSNNNSMQAYWEDCDIHGVVDFICGGGDVRFQNTLITLEKREPSGSGGRTISAATTTTKFGYVFDGCKIVDLSEKKGNWNYSRTWQNKPIVVFLNTILDNVAEKTITSSRWTGLGMNNTDIYIFGEYNTMNENLENITPTSNKVTSYNGTYETILTEEQAKEYSYEKMFSENAKAWNPAALTKQVEAPATSYANGELTWTPVDKATAYAIFKNDVFVAIVGPETTSYAIDANFDTDVLSIRSANEMGGFGDPTILDSTSLGIKANATDMKTGNIYDLQGRKLNHIPEKGIYIHNGNKFTHGRHIR